VVVVIAIVVFGASTSSEFLTGSNFFNIGLGSGEIAIMALPMTLIIISGEIDLSVASTMGMSSALLGVLWSTGWPMLAIFAVLLLLGAAAGLLNGLLVTRVGLPSLAVTIGTLALFRGIALIIIGSNTVSDFPAAYTNMGVEPIPHTQLSYSAGIFIVLAIRPVDIRHGRQPGRGAVCRNPGEADQDPAVRDLRRGLRHGRGAADLPPRHGGPEQRPWPGT
jgi:rhamnose transport system permease protein